VLLCARALRKILRSRSLKTKGKDKVLLPDGRIMTLSEVFDLGLVHPSMSPGDPPRYFALSVHGDVKWEIGKTFYESRAKEGVSLAGGKPSAKKDSASRTIPVARKSMWHEYDSPGMFGIARIWALMSPWDFTLGEVKLSEEDGSYWWRVLKKSGMTEWDETESFEAAKDSVERESRIDNPGDRQAQLAERLSRAE